MIDPQARMSTAQRSIGSASPVSVSFAQTKTDPEELRRSSARVMNLQQLVMHVFDGSMAGLALHAEMAPDRLRPLLEMHIPFSAEIAEHLEKCLNLPGGWLDIRRTSIDVAHLKEIIFAPSKSGGHDLQDSATRSEGVSCDTHQASKEASKEAPKEASHDLADSAFSKAPVFEAAVVQPAVVQPAVVQPAQNVSVQGGMQGYASSLAPSSVAAAPIKEPVLGRSILSVKHAPLPSQSDVAPAIIPLIAITKEYIAQESAVQSVAKEVHDMASDQAQNDQVQQGEKEGGAPAAPDAQAGKEAGSSSGFVFFEQGGVKRYHYPMGPTLIWLNKELDRFRSNRGGPIRPEIAEAMGRAPSTLSTWLTGARKMPDEMMGPLVRAIAKISPTLAVELQERMIVAAPAVMRHLPILPMPSKISAPVEPQATVVDAVVDAVVAPVVGAVVDATSELASDATKAKVETAAAETVVQAEPAAGESQKESQKPSSLSMEDQLRSQLIALDGSRSSGEMDLIVAKAVDRLAIILQRLLDR